MVKKLDIKQEKRLEQILSGITQVTGFSAAAGGALASLEKTFHPDVYQAAVTLAHTYPNHLNKLPEFVETVDRHISSPLEGGLIVAGGLGIILAEYFLDKRFKNYASKKKISSPLNGIVEGFGAKSISDLPSKVANFFNFKSEGEAFDKFDKFTEYLQKKKEKGELDKLLSKREPTQEQYLEVFEIYLNILSFLSSHHLIESDRIYSSYKNDVEYIFKTVISYLSDHRDYGTNFHIEPLKIAKETAYLARLKIEGSKPYKINNAVSDEQKKNNIVYDRAKKLTEYLSSAQIFLLNKATLLK
jgi:hypothetical protein